MTTTHEHGRAVLASLADNSPEYGSGLTDHAPMAIEALERIGPHAIDAFCARYVPRLRPLDREPDPQLRGFARASSVIAERIDREGAEAVLVDDAPSLARSVAGAAFHGIIRVAHAVRGLRRDDHPVRRGELARALAYASARADVLPQRPARSSEGTSTLREALERLAPSPEALVHRAGMITPTLVARAAAHPRLGSVSASLRREGSPVARAIELRSEAATLLARGEHAPGVTFTLLHAVTGAEAVLTLARVLPADHASELVSEGAHALLAMRVAFVGALDRPLTSTSPWAELRTRAIESLDDHAIKLAASLDDKEGLTDEVRCAALWAWLSRLARA